MLTKREEEQIDRINRQSGYMLYKVEMEQMIRSHKNARAVGDKHTMEAIEYRLTQINFHYERGLLCAGKYDEAKKSLKDW